MSRALLTETERKVLTGQKDADSDYRAVVRSRVKTRISQLHQDVDALAHEPELLNRLGDVLEQALPAGVNKGDDPMGEGAKKTPTQPEPTQETSSAAGTNVNIRQFVDELDQWGGGDRDQVADARVDALETLRELAGNEQDRLPLRELLKNMTATVDRQTSSHDQDSPNQSVFYRKTLLPALDAAKDEGRIKRKSGDDYGFWWVK